jgi:light-regulated signal transduction histidine kinase (bacteriophytochrome)
MGQLIDDLLNLSRVTRGELHSRRFDLSKIAEDVADELRKTSEGEKTAFTIEPGMKAQGDDRLVRIVLSNMMGNAVKFSAKGKAPKVELGTTKADGGLAYYVRDNGVGFDTNYADKLFMAFQRLHSDREFAGTGIGLAMVQRIVHRHGGRVWAESELGKGSTFYFTLGD